MTHRLYWEDDHCYSSEARVVAMVDHEVACDQTCFYFGGGAQPPNHGTLSQGDQCWTVTSVRADKEGVVWHALGYLPDSPQPRRQSHVLAAFN